MYVSGTSGKLIKPYNKWRYKAYKKNKTNFSKTIKFNLIKYKNAFYTVKNILKALVLLSLNSHIICETQFIL